jgi:hypothetical protein
VSWTVWDNLPCIVSLWLRSREGSPLLTSQGFCHLLPPCGQSSHHRADDNPSSLSSGGRNKTNTVTIKRLMLVTNWLFWNPRVPSATKWVLLLPRRQGVSLEQLPQSWWKNTLWTHRVGEGWFRKGRGKEELLRQQREPRLGPGLLHPAGQSQRILRVCLTLGTANSS